MPLVTHPLTIPICFCSHFFRVSLILPWLCSPPASVARCTYPDRPPYWPNQAKLSPSLGLWTHAMPSLVNRLAGPGRATLAYTCTLGLCLMD
jgi:hypothetical protein